MKSDEHGIFASLYDNNTLIRRKIAHIYDIYVDIRNSWKKQCLNK